MSQSSRFGWIRNPWVIGITVVAIAGGIFALSRQSTSDTTTVDSDTVNVSRGNIVSIVTGSGNIAADNSLDLTFQTSGVIAEVLVKENDKVSKGQRLATLDTRDLAAQVASAKAALDSAEARFTQIAQGNSLPSEISSAQAAVASAQAQLKSARENLAALRKPSTEQLSAAELRVTQAEASLQTTRDSASATKSKAEIDLSKASETLIQAQSRYQSARDDWKWVLDYGTDPTNSRRRLGDSEINGYRDAFVQAESSVRSAEQSVEQAQITVNNAREAEKSNVTQAEQVLKDAQIQLEALRNPTASNIAAAEATVEQNEAALEQAKANLDKLVVPGTESDVVIQQAAVEQAKQSYVQAQLRLENATIVAPFDGIIATVHVIAGQSATAATTAISIIDREPLHLDLKLSENDIVLVQNGDSAELSIDALPDWQQIGTITSISPAADTSSGIAAYRARIDFTDGDARVLVGMTANASIVVEERNDILVIPNSALLPKGTGRVVQIRGADGQITEIDVTTGLSDGIYSEVLSGLEEGQEIIETPLTRQETPGGFGRP
jgi:HlyD family secretion protein